MKSVFRSYLLLPPGTFSNLEEFNRILMFNNLLVETSSHLPLDQVLDWQVKGGWFWEGLCNMLSAFWECSL